jgi:molybdate transport system ATP-binding protein
LLDEPLAALDIDARREVLSFLAEYLRALSIPALVVTHEAKEARGLAPRVAVLERGALSQLGSWEEVVAGPASPFVASFTAGQGAESAA